MIAAFLFIVLMLPLIKAAIDYSVLRIRREACASILEASLPAAYLAVSAEQLSLGRLSLDHDRARAEVERLLRQNMVQARIQADLTNLSIVFSTVNRREDSGHWLSGQRPDAMPVISATAEWAFRDGWRFSVADRIELVLD